jgi:transposase-like protein
MVWKNNFSFIKTQNQTIMIKSTTIHRQGVEWIFSQPLNIQLEVLSNHLEICKAVINSLLQGSVEQQAGRKYCRAKPFDGRYSRWGVNPGSVRIGNQKLAVAVPRVQDHESGEIKNVELYNEVKDLPEQKEEMVMSVLKGISMRDYSEVATQLLDSFGLSSSSISRHFIERSSQAVEQFCNRRWDEHHFVSLFIDGKSLAGEQMIIAMGITDQGEKIPLAVVQSSTENSQVISAMLSELIEKGFRYDEGLLVVIDGSRGIRKAVEEVFGNRAVIQRCQWHKRENVISYLKEELQDSYRQQLQNAYRQQNYQLAKKQLLSIAEQLKQHNLQASRSLEEGLEETLTLQRLGLMSELGRSFSTTNCIENLNSQIEKYIRKVKHWMNSEQRYRWVIMAMLEAENKMHKVQGYKKLYRLQEVLKKDINRNQ